MLTYFVLINHKVKRKKAVLSYFMVVLPFSLCGLFDLYYLVLLTYYTNAFIITMEINAFVILIVMSSGQYFLGTSTTPKRRPIY